jgi:hypothetical protein
MTRLDGAPAQQDAVFPLRQGADHQARIAVMDHAAGVADMARQAVAGRYAQADRGTAGAAKFIAGSMRILARCPPRLPIRMKW